MKGVPTDYNEYEIQREIVKNIYLDRLLATVLEGRHIPPIVLVVEENEFTVREPKLDIINFKILDGLQRTFRLKTIYDTKELFKDSFSNDKSILQLTKLELSRKFREQLDLINSTSSMFSAIAEYFRSNCDGSLEKLDQIFERKQWFEIWAGLSADDEVRKMLVLNAGHKPVKTKHQLELLYRSVLTILTRSDFPTFEIVREKDPNSARFSKDRRVGQFHFAHLIMAVLSLSQGRALTSNVDLIDKVQADFFPDELFERYLTYDYLRAFVQFLLDLDASIQREYGEVGTRWLGRETSIVGFFAAVGRFTNENKMDPVMALNVARGKVLLHAGVLNLTDFEEKRNSQNLAKINIGNVNKRAISTSVYDILNGSDEPIDWQRYFNQ